jgi:hypothetical protein
VIPRSGSNSCLRLHDMNNYYNFFFFSRPELEAGDMRPKSPVGLPQLQPGWNKIGGEVRCLSVVIA